MTKTILSPEDRERIIATAGALDGMSSAIGKRRLADALRDYSDGLMSIVNPKNYSWTGALNAKSCKKTNSATRRVEICKKTAKNDSSGNIFSSFTDPRDGQIYHTVYIPQLKQTWMLENLKYNPKKKGHWTRNGQHYYNFDLAQKVAPKGWRVPSKDDFIKLTESLSWEKLNKLWGKYEDHLQGWIGSEFKLYGKGSYGDWWSSTVSGSANAYFLHVDEVNYSPQGVGGRWNGNSVRCVQDLEK